MQDIEVLCQGAKFLEAQKLLLDILNTKDSYDSDIFLRVISGLYQRKQGVAANQLCKAFLQSKKYLGGMDRRDINNEDVIARSIGDFKLVWEKFTDTNFNNEFEDTKEYWRKNWRLYIWLIHDFPAGWLAVIKNKWEGFVATAHKVLRVLHEGERPDQAMCLCKTLLILSPNDPEAKRQKSVMLSDMARRYYTRKAEINFHLDINKFASREEQVNTPSYVRYVGYHYRLTEQYLRDAIALDKDNIDAWLLMGDNLSLQFKHEEARQCYETALAQVY